MSALAADQRELGGLVGWERLADRIPLMDARDVRRADDWMARTGDLR